MKIGEKRPYLGGSDPQTEAQAAKRPRPGSADQPPGPKLPPELLPHVVRHLKEVNFALFEPPRRDAVGALTAARSASYAMAQAVDSEHPELLAYAASQATAHFLEHENLRAADVPELFKMLANAQSLSFRVTREFSSSHDCEKLQHIIRAAPRLHTLAMAIQSTVDTAGFRDFVLDLRHLDKLRTLELAASVDTGLYGPPLKITLPEQHHLEDLTLTGPHSSAYSTVCELLEKTSNLRRLTLDNGAEFLVQAFRLPVDLLARAQQLQQLSLAGHWACDHRGIAALVQRLPHLDTLEVSCSMDNHDHQRVPLLHPLLSTPLPQLKYLTLSGFRLTPNRLPVLDLTNAPNLTELDLRNFDFGPVYQDIPPLKLRACDKLEQLFLEESNLTLRDLGRSGVGPAIMQGKLKVDLLT